MKRISAHAGIVNKRQTKARMACMEGCHYFQASPTAGENRPRVPQDMLFLIAGHSFTVPPSLTTEPAGNLVPFKFRTAPFLTVIRPKFNDCPSIPSKNISVPADNTQEHFREEVRTFLNTILAALCCSPPFSRTTCTSACRTEAQAEPSVQRRRFPRRYRYRGTTGNVPGLPSRQLNISLDEQIFSFRQANASRSQHQPVPGRASTFNHHRIHRRIFHPYAEQFLLCRTPRSA